MWVFIAQEVLFFGGLFAAYAVYRSHVPGRLLRGQPPPQLEARLRQHARPDRLEPHHGHGRPLGRHREEAPDRRASCSPPSFSARVFLGVKYFEYGDKIRPCLGDGPYTGCLVPGERFDAAALHLEGAEGGHAQIYFSLYFGMTGLHALHMIIGMPIILGIAFLAWQGPVQPRVPLPGRARGALLALRGHHLDLPLPPPLPHRGALTMSEHATSYPSRSTWASSSPSASSPW